MMWLIAYVVGWIGYWCWRKYDNDPRVFYYCSCENRYNDTAHHEYFVCWRTWARSLVYPLLLIRVLSIYTIYLASSLIPDRLEREKISEDKENRKRIAKARRQEALAQPVDRLVAEFERLEK